ATIEKSRGRNLAGANRRFVRRPSGKDASRGYLPMTASPAMTGAPRAKRGRRPLLVGLVAIIIVAAASVGWLHLPRRPEAGKPEPAPSVPVIATPVKERAFPIVQMGIGYVTALNSATVRSMVTEQIVSIDFKDGQLVKRGDLLARLDPSTYQAQL